MLSSIVAALSHATEPLTLAMLLAGVLTGLVLGAIPGVGGLFGLVVMVPFTYHLDPYSAFALLLGITAVTTISDTIPAVLIGIPGTVGAIATVEDGHPLARQGHAAKALGAAYSASLIGGVFGAFVLFVSIPFLSDIITTLKTPDFLAVTVIGMLFVASVSGSDPLKGLGSLILGVLASFVGLDSITGSERFTGGSIFLWDGLAIGVIFVGVFGLPELAALISRKQITDHGRASAVATSSLLDGIRETLKRWRLVLACSSIGVLVGAIPGVGVTVIDWVAYGLAKRFTKDGPQFGQGNIAGVIAPEAANNAKEGGYLLPTIALGLPGSVTMSILLAAFTVQGLVPGPTLLRDNQPIIYAMVFFVALANVVGVLLCVMMTRPLIRLSILPTHYIVSVALSFVVIGALSEHMDFRDILLLMAAGAVGWIMRIRSWSRAAFSLGFVLGPNLERYFFLTGQLYEPSVMMRPSIFVAIMMAVGTAVYFVRWSSLRNRSDGIAVHIDGLELSSVLGLLMISIAAYFSLANLPSEARLFPQITSILLSLTSITMLIRYSIWRRRAVQITYTSSNMVPFRSVLAVMSACLALTGLLYLVDHRFAVFLFVSGYIAMSHPPSATKGMIVGLGTSAVVFTVFDLLISLSWPDTIF